MVEGKKLGEIFPHPGFLIRRLRDERSWSQESLAATIGVTRKTIQNWESGNIKKTINITNAKQLGKLFDIDYRIFLGKMPSDRKFSKSRLFFEIEIPGRTVELQIKQHYESRFVNEVRDTSLFFCNQDETGPLISTSGTSFSLSSGANIAITFDDMEIPSSIIEKDLKDNIAYLGWNVRDWEGISWGESEVNARDVTVVFLYGEDIKPSSGDKEIFEYLMHSVRIDGYILWSDSSRKFNEIKLSLVRELLSRDRADLLRQIYLEAGRHIDLSAICVRNAIMDASEQKMTKILFSKIFGRDPEDYEIRLFGIR